MCITIHAHTNVCLHALNSIHITSAGKQANIKICDAVMDLLNPPDALSRSPSLPRKSRPLRVTLYRRAQHGSLASLPDSRAVHRPHCCGPHALHQLCLGSSRCQHAHSVSKLISHLVSLALVLRETCRRVSPLPTTLLMLTLSSNESKIRKEVLTCLCCKFMKSLKKKKNSTKFFLNRTKKIR